MRSKIAMWLAIIAALLLAPLAGCTWPSVLNFFTAGTQNSDQYFMVQKNKGFTQAVPPDPNSP